MSKWERRDLHIIEISYKPRITQRLKAVEDRRVELGLVLYKIPIYTPRDLSVSGLSIFRDLKIFFTIEKL